MDYADRLKAEKRKINGLSIDCSPLSWYNVCVFAMKGGLFMPGQVKKSPVSIGLLAHVGASK